MLQDATLKRTKCWSIPGFFSA